MDSATSERVIEALLDQVDELQASSGAAPGLLNGAIYYSSPGLPNPQIVDYYASEVGVLGELYKIQKVVDVMANENRSPEVCQYLHFLSPIDFVFFLEDDCDEC
jgi:hypothetical protein